MANPSCLNRRLLLAVIRSPSARSNLSSFASRTTPGQWVRLITHSSTRHNLDAPGISFGEENDQVIAPYIEKLKKKSKSRRSKNAEVAPQDAAIDDYEISGFIDRSSPSPSKFARSLDDAMTAKKPTRRSRTVEYMKKDDSRYIEKAANSSKGGNHKDTRIGQRPSKQNPLVRTHRSESKSPSQHLKREDLSEKPTPEKPEREPWMTQKNALKQKFEEGWNPRKKLSPDAIEGIRGLHEQDPIKYTTELLADQFKVSPEAIRRILKSKWLSQQSPEKLQERRERWAKRHDRIWDQQAALGLRPKRTKDKEVENPDQFEQDLERRRLLGEI